MRAQSNIQYNVETTQRSPTSRGKGQLSSQSRHTLGTGESVFISAKPSHMPCLNLHGQYKRPWIGGNRLTASRRLRPPRLRGNTIKSGIPVDFPPANIHPQRVSPNSISIARSSQSCQTESSQLKSRGRPSLW